MLLVEVDITANCPKGANVAELRVAHIERVRLSNNQLVDKNVMAAVYTQGMPLGEGGQPVEAPIDLKVGDLVRVQAAPPQEPREVFDVTRNGKVIWPAAGEGLPAEEEARQQWVAQKLEKRKELL